MVAALFDLNFEVKGYLLILSNDFFTAAYGVSIKRALNLKIPQTRCGKLGGSCVSSVLYDTRAVGNSKAPVFVLVGGLFCLSPDRGILYFFFTPGRSGQRRK